MADVLRENADARARVFVVWEPVLQTDWGTLNPSITSTLPDRRVVQFWDPERKLSALLGGVSKLDSLAAERKIGFRMKDVVWDTALVYPAGVRWGAPANLIVAPVVKWRDELAARIKE